MSVVLSGRDLCDELITRPEDSYRLCCVVVCDLENVKNDEAMTRVGSQRHSKKKLASIAETETSLHLPAIYNGHSPEHVLISTSATPHANEHTIISVPTATAL